MQRAYLNVPRDEAIRRYMESEGYKTPPPKDLIREFDFLDEFSTYSAYPKYDRDE
jgi:hypothetical protein